MRRPRKAGFALALGLAFGGLSSSSGCATLTGLVTGAFTGAVDAPAQVYRAHRSDFNRNPIYWPFNILLFVPLGIAVGPIAGAGKGMALDIESVILDRTTYGQAFGTYQEPSVWRPLHDPLVGR
jgi:hypothetical protein